MDGRTNEPNNKKVDNYAQGYTSKRLHRKLQEKEEKENLPVLRTALVLQYKDSRTTLKRAKND